MKRMNLDDVELAYEVRGTGEPVVFIHGAFIADAFRPVLAELELAGRFRLIHYHRRGYAGSSPADGTVSILTGASDCIQLLRRLGIERAHIVGHSYGGAVALQMALSNPAFVQTVALLEPGLMIGESARGYREALVKGGDRYREAPAAVVVDEFLQARWPGPGYRDAIDRALPGAFGEAVAAAPTWFECELPGLLEWQYGEAESRSVTQPALSLLGGESDALWDRFGETHRLLLEWLPDAEGVVLPGTTHFPQFQDPQGLASALAAFLSRHAIGKRDEATH